MLGAGSDTEIGQLGSSLSWILLKGIVFSSANPNYGTLDSKPKPNPMQSSMSGLGAEYNGIKNNTLVTDLALSSQLYRIIIPVL